MYPKYVRVNARDLYLAIREGCRPMTTFYDPRHEGLPFFANEMTGAAWGNAHHQSFSMAHVPGRWLNALLNVKNVLPDADVPEECLDKLAAWAYRAIESTGMGLPACLNLQTMQPEPQTDLHNLREQMHAFYALWKYRGDEKARDMAFALIDTVDQFLDMKNGRWDEARFYEQTAGRVLRWQSMNQDDPFPITFGRYIGPLVKFYRSTGAPKALAQAIRLKNICLNRVFDLTGRYDSWIFGSHTHSTTATLSSLAQLYQVTHEQRLLDAILAFMDNGLKDIALDVGWCTENTNRTDCVGEVNNTADIMETCLILGQCGIKGAYARAERILRGHYLPSQLLDTSFLPDDDDKRHIGRYHMRERAKGAFGFPCPFGHEDHPGAAISFNWDIVGGAVGGLCEAVRGAVTRQDTLVSINLLFDRETEDVSFFSPYGREDTAVLRVKRAGLSARVRIPGGASAWQTNIPDTYADGEWLYIGALPPGKACKIHFDFSGRKEQWRFRDQEYSVTWRGEEIVSCTSAGKRLCFFPEETA